MKEKLETIEKFIRYFINSHVIITKRDNQISLQLEDRFLDFTIDEEDIEGSVVASAEKGIGWDFETIF